MSHLQSHSRVLPKHGHVRRGSTGTDSTTTTPSLFPLTHISPLCLEHKQLSTLQVTFTDKSSLPITPNTSPASSSPRSPDRTRGSTPGRTSTPTSIHTPTSTSTPTSSTLTPTNSTLSLISSTKTSPSVQSQSIFSREIKYSPR
eukprot:TRINITY_DN30068_c0_g2_i1.p1 TRINITY_DN30068_c0_g2~~TRINITY_DN30068_c0_g2_i1.p1  ORF type:complete len:144 (+),score=15.49 TRINITY_DN30068_c0_g2_i1:460-891(+)